MLLGVPQTAQTRDSAFADGLINREMELQWRVERAVVIAGELADQEWEKLERGERSGEALQALEGVIELLAGVETGISRTYFEAGVVTRVRLFEKDNIRGELLCLGTNAETGVTVLPWRFGISRVVSGLAKYMTLGNMSRREDGRCQADVISMDEVSPPALHYHSSPSTQLRGLAVSQESIVMDVFYQQPATQLLTYDINETRNGTAILIPSKVPTLWRDKGYRGSPLHLP